MSAQNAARGAIAQLLLLVRVGGRVRRLQLLATLILTVAGSLAELITIGAVIPLLIVVSDPSRLTQLRVVGPAISRGLARVPTDPVITAAAALAVAAIISTLLRVMLNWVTLQFVYGLHEDLVRRIYGLLIQQPYDWYARQHSSALLSAVEKTYLVAVGVLAPLLNSLTALVMASIIIVFLFLINPIAAFIALTVIGSIYGVMSYLSQGWTRRVSSGEAALRTLRLKTLQETFGGIRDVILDQTQSVFNARMAVHEAEFRRLNVASNLIATSPRLVVEGAIIVLVAALAVWFNSKRGGIIHALPALGALALGAQRILPMIQTIYFGAVSYTLRRETVKELIGYLELPEITPPKEVVPSGFGRFARSIELDDVTFAYAGSKPALQNLSLKIQKGERIGLVGKTGSGKSTLVDIFLGLLAPTNGNVLIDNEPLRSTNVAAWKAQVAHVPQSIFLSDDSIAANIAFGQDKHLIDVRRVEDAARKAGLYDFITDLPDRLQSLIGERGVRLSGGQRQRIGIARALYKDATLLILDEATSALDYETESVVMEAVDQLASDLTIIIVAHRLTTLAGCDRIYRLAAGRVVAISSYAEMREASAEDDLTGSKSA